MKVTRRVRFMTAHWGRRLFVIKFLTRLLLIGRRWGQLGQKLAGGRGKWGSRRWLPRQL